MGGTAHVTVTGDHAGRPGDALGTARHELSRLEERWSRFLPDSDISRLNRSGGNWVAVSTETIEMLEWCVRLWRRTGGAFDPTVGSILENLGYDRSFEDVVAAAPPRPLPTEHRPPPGCRGIEIDRVAGRARIPAGVRLDAGGLAKGLAADLVAEALISAGVAGACVNLSGDVSARGDGPGGPGSTWSVGVEHPLRPGAVLAVVHLDPEGGAVASSSTLLRRWHGRHHLVDTTTGAPSATGLAAVTVIHRSGACADAYTKIAFSAPSPDQAVDTFEELQAAAILFLEDGRELWTSPLEAARA